MAQIGIILATYNGEKYLREQLESILSNTFTDYEIHICDDGSTDGTVAIAKEYVEKYPQISLWQNEKNQGYTKNFLQAMKRETTPYVMLCDQDDIWKPDKIEMTYRAMKEAEESENMPILVFTDAENYDDATKKDMGSFHKTSHLDTKKFDTAHLFMENKCIGCTIMCNAKVRDYLTELPEEIRVHDWWLALICSHFGKVIYLDKMTLHYRQHSDNMIGTSSFFQYLAQRISHWKEQKEAIRATMAQGNAFYHIFGDKIQDPKRKKCAYEFSKMSEKNVIMRRYLAVHYGFLKSGLVRNIALLFLI
ncbi:MAG: glycosyltransferase family 2 protein [Eubacterium sp.]